jgi:hypothetical protein
VCVRAKYEQPFHDLTQLEPAMNPTMIPTFYETKRSITKTFHEAKKERKKKKKFDKRPPDNDDERRR